MTITRKIKIINLVLLSIRPILDLLRKKNWNFEKCWKIFNFGGFCPPAPPPGLHPLDPACFWIEDFSRNRYALNGIQRIACFTVFFLHNSKNNNRKNLKFGFSFYSADSRSFMWIWPLLIFFKVVKFTWKIQNLLNRKKNQIFSIIIFRVMIIFRHFCYKKRQFSLNFSGYLDK